MAQWRSLLRQKIQFAASIPYRIRWQRLRSLVLLVLVGGLMFGAISACARNTTTSGNGKPNVELTLVSYTIPKAAYDAIIPKFQAKWQAEHGQHVTFYQSYGASAPQTRAILDGLDADVAHLAIGADVNKLVSAGYVDGNWATRSPNKGIVGETVAAIITRPGNPKNIQSFPDLTRADVKWVTADPKSSGVARWSFFTLWNYAQQTGLDEARTIDFLTQAYQNVAVLARDARESTDVFANQGQGDALVNYENEVILAIQRGTPLEYIIPDINFSVDTPITLIDRNVAKHRNWEVAQAFVEYLFTADAQREFARVGFRPIGAVSQEPEFVQQFPPIQKLGTIDQFGGWQTAQEVFQDGGKFDQIRSQMAQS